MLNAQGEPIAGLYAAGNEMNSIMAGTYPGPGITIGPALTFAYLAAKDIAGRLNGATATTSTHSTQPSGEQHVL